MVYLLIILQGYLCKCFKTYWITYSPNKEKHVWSKICNPVCQHFQDLFLDSPSKFTITLCHQSYFITCNPHNRTWRPVGLFDVEDPTMSRQSAHRWR
jgi:hypothetical protein